MKMKVGIKFTAVLFFFALSFSLGAQLNFIEWQKSYGGSGFDFAHDIKQLSDGGYIIAGYTLSDDYDVNFYYGYQDFWVVRIDSTGVIIWEKTYGGSSIDQALSIEPTQDDGFIVAGYTLSNDFDVSGNHGYYDMWVLKLTSEGNITWKNTYGGSSNETGYDIIPTSDGGYMLVGLTTSTDGDVSENDGEIDVWAVKIDSTGTIQWEKTFGGTEIDIAFTVAQTTDGGYIIGTESLSDDGDVSDAHGATDIWMLKLDQEGGLVWQKSLGGSQGEGARSVQQTPDGGYIIVGTTSSDDGDVTGFNGVVDIWVVKTDENANIIWQRSLGTSSEEYGASVDLTSDGGYIVSGSLMPFYDIPDQELDYWVIKLNSMGGTEWQKTYGGSKNDMSFAVQQTSDGHFILAGFSTSNDGDVSGNHGDADMWIAKLGASVPYQLTISINDTTIVTENGIYAYAIVSLSGPSTEVVKVDYRTKNGTAIKGIDYLGTSGTLRFLPGQTSRNIRVTIKADVIQEPDEYFMIKLSDPVNAELLNDEGIVIITESGLEQNFNVDIPSHAIYRPFGSASHEPIIPNPQSKQSVFQVFNLASNNVEVLLMNEEGKILLESKHYNNDWTMEDLDTGIYLYRIRIKTENDIPLEFSGKLIVID